ncbi:MAG: hypothetical protein LEGION0403_FIIPPAGN_02903 [Legionella sp.]|uniref:hypothetical protein n=1 Tax=Legionella sp. TaxID=459 RepID=UPI003D14918B
MNNNQNTTALQIINKKQYLVESKNDELYRLLSSEEQMRLINGSREFRKRVYTPLKTIYTFIKQVLSSDKSCKNAVSGVIAEGLLKDKNVICSSTGSYTKARNRLPEKTLYELFKLSGDFSLKKQRESHSFGRELKAFDGTIITLPDTQANNSVYPKHSNKTDSVGFPQIRLVAVLSLSTGGVIDYALDANKGKGTGEISLLRSILDSIHDNDIVVGDRLYCNFF